MTNAELTEAVAPIDYLVNSGAKNLLKPNLTTRTLNGITFTLNDDGSVTLNGTATANASINNGYVAYLKAGTYKVSGAPATSTGAFLRLASGETGATYIASVNDEYTLTVAQDGYYAVGPFVNNGRTVDNLTFYPMIRDASIADDAYEPYKLSAAEITAELSDTGWQTLTGGTKYRKKNGVVHVRVYETGDAIPTLTGGSWNNLYTLPVGARPTETIEGVISLRKVSGNVCDIYPAQINTGGAIQILIPNSVTINSTTHNAVYGGLSFPV